MINKEQINNFKNNLEKTKTDLEQQIKELGVTPEFGSDVDHGDEETDETEAIGTNLGTAEAFKTRFNDVVHALGKITTDTYGVCENCRKEIELKILEIDPESRLCQNCKKAKQSNKVTDNK